MSRRTEVRVGVTVLVALAILAGSVAWLKDFALHRAKRVWRVTFPEAGGLSSSDEVLVNGIRKGEVKSMKLAGDRVLVELALAREVTLTRDCRVVVRNVGLMGEKVIAVDLRSGGVAYAAGDTIEGTYEMGLGEVLGRLGETVGAVLHLSGELERVAESLAREGGLVATVRTFNRTGEELRLAVSENRATLRAAIADFAAASRTARGLTTDREEKLSQALDSFAAAAGKMEELSGRLDSLRSVIQSVTDKVDRGEGTLGKLVQDEQLYADLNGSVQSLKELIQDIKAHPKRYLKFSIF